MAIGIASVVSVLPEFTTLQSQLAWTHFGNAATPPPVPSLSAYRLLVDGPVAPLTMSFWMAGYLARQTKRRDLGAGSAVLS